MSKSVLVVVDADAWVHRAIAAAVSDSIDVVPCATARGALNACCALEPACVLSALHLPDQTGLWLAAQLRAQPSRVSVTPFAILSAFDAEETRLNALRSGAAVFLTKPFKLVELVAQLRALIAMSERVRRAASRESFLPAPGVGGSDRERAIMGDLDRMSVPTVLCALEIEQRSGELVLSGGREGERRLVLRVASGALTSGALGARELSPLAALQEALKWPGKRFSFWAGEPRPAPEGCSSIGALVVAAVRIEEAEPSEADEELDLDCEVPPHRSGTRPKVDPRAGQTQAAAKRAPLAVASAGGAPGAPGARLVESMSASARNDPRAEVSDDSETLERLGVPATRR